MAYAKHLEVLINHLKLLGQRALCKTRMSDVESSKSSQSSKLSLDYINNVIERLKCKQTRQSTAKNYLSIWRHLNRFIISLDTRENLTWE